ncbi:hypothetical protein NIES2134_121900 [Thermostichus vulcanus NIES-2134]|nr:hypothetical protein NIES2134_121900 [Thermostichus vulcanus NIES-2134]
MTQESAVSLPNWLLRFMLPTLLEGQEWGHQFLCDPQWQGDRDRMAKHAIYEATLWSLGTGVSTGLMGWFGLPLDIGYFYYSQTKLAAALFTIYGLDMGDESVLMMLIAAAFGVRAAELANYFGTELCRQVFSTFARRSLENNLPQVLPKAMQQLPGPLVQQVGRVSSRSVTVPVRALPLISGVIGGATNAIIINAFGHGVCQLIKTFQSPATR